MSGGKSATFSNDILKLIFNAVGIANIADNAASSPLTNFYLALHTADPGLGGDQTTSEAAYISYARVAVARSTAGFTVNGQQVQLVSNANFPVATGGSETETWFSVGVASSGTSKILYRGQYLPNLAVSNGIQPIIPTSMTITEG